MRNYYTDEEIDYLKENYNHMSIAELQKELNDIFHHNRSYPSVKSALHRHNLYKKPHNDSVRGFTIEEDEWLLENALKYSCEEMESMMLTIFGRLHKAETIKSHCREKLGIIKGRYYIADGKRGCRYLPLGTISSIGDRCYIKVDDAYGHGKDIYLNNWVPYGRYLYEQAHGKLPDNMQVIHMNGDSTDFSIDNLIAVSQKEHLYLTTHDWHGLGEITRTGVMLCELDELIKEAKI